MNLEALRESIKTIFKQNFETSRANIAPNTATQGLTFDNTGKWITAAVLFIDIRSSSTLTQVYDKSSLAKIYKAFYELIVKITKSYKATIGNFIGDRLMVISDDTTSPCLIAIQIALDMQRGINQILNNEIINHGGKRLITCGIGIDYGEMLATKVGIKGENNQDLVWIGNTANIASKLTDQADGHEIRISKIIYDMLKKMKEFKSHRWTPLLVNPLVLCYKTSVTIFDKPDLGTLLLKYKQQSS